MSENEKQASVPYFVHEGQMARMERVLKIVCVVFLLAIAIVSSALIINDNHWRQYCSELEDRYVAYPGIYEQPNKGPDS